MEGYAAEILLGFEVGFGCRFRFKWICLVIFGLWGCCDWGLRVYYCSACHCSLGFGCEFPVANKSDGVRNVVFTQ